VIVVLVRQSPLRRFASLGSVYGSPFNALLAFTDVVKDAKDGQKYTEAKMNGFPEATTGDVEKRMNYEL